MKTRTGTFASYHQQYPTTPARTTNDEITVNKQYQLKIEADLCLPENVLKYLPVKCDKQLLSLHQLFLSSVHSLSRNLVRIERVN